VRFGESVLEPLTAAMTATRLEVYESCYRYYRFLSFCFTIRLRTLGGFESLFKMKKKLVLVILVLRYFLVQQKTKAYFRFLVRPRKTI